MKTNIVPAAGDFSSRAKGKRSYLFLYLITISLTINPKGSEKSNITFRACPNIEGGPWYDFVSILIQEDDPITPTKTKIVEYAAKILAFVELQKRDSATKSLEEPETQTGEDGVFAWCEFYIDATPENMKKKSDLSEERKNARDLSVTNKYNNLPFVTLDPNVGERYGLMDVSYIVEGLWLQQDFTEHDKFWVLSSRLAYFEEE